MSDDKTELPTPKKERDAREKGQVARSQEVVTAVSLFAVVGVVWGMWTPMTERLIASIDRAGTLAADDFAKVAMEAILLTAGDVVWVLVPVLGVAIVAAIAANTFQFGLLISLESVSPKLNKLSPAAGFKRIFSMKQVVDLVKSLIKIIFLSILLYQVLEGSLSDFLKAASCGMPCLNMVTSEVLMKTLTYSAFAFGIVALADFAYQRRSHTKSLMMSKDEIKREYKESEGDPHIKGKRKQIAQELASSDSGHAARSGSAVVVNPTHFAVVLSYRPDEMPLPMITAKGRNLNAHFLREEAEKAGVPIFRHVKLARSLFAAAEPGQPVPDELFDAVAEILAWVARHRETLYNGPSTRGVIDMEAGEHMKPRSNETSIELPF
ncbi:MAG: type III secretion system export apparatus subunit SctU [Mesorhizobium sp.]